MIEAVSGDVGQVAVDRECQSLGEHAMGQVRIGRLGEAATVKLRLGKAPPFAGQPSWAEHAPAPRLAGAVRLPFLETLICAADQRARQSGGRDHASSG